MAICRALVTVVLGIVSLTPPGVERTPLGRRIPLVEEAVLFIPEGCRAADKGHVDVVLHLHGAASVVEPAFVEAGWPAQAILIEFNRKGLSSVYSKPFSDATPLRRLLDSALDALKQEKVAEAPRVGQLVVSSFSAGFGGVRELLKVPENFARIDGLVLADSLYCGYTGDPARKRVDSALMDGFRRFALDAAAGRKAMVLTHSAQVPGTYASTTETADFLIDAVGAKAEPSHAEWADGWVQTRLARQGKFLAVGFEGAGPDDHMKHLRRIGLLWKRLRTLD